MSDTPIRTPAPEWSRGLSQEDTSAMLREQFWVFFIKHFQFHLFAILELSTLSPNALIMEIKKIYDEAYQLGVSEAKEMTRGKYLGIFNNAKKKN